MLVVIALTVLLAICIHYIFMGTFGYWKKKGVPYPKPKPLLGNITSLFFQTKMFGEVFEDIYKQFEDCKYVGIYKGRVPALLVRDPEIVKDVLVKNFNSFHDNESFLDEKVDALVAKNPFFLRGQKWKIVRSQITSAITTGKIKSMFNLMSSVGQSMVEYLKNTPEAYNKEGLETKELAAKFTTDVVALCAFGLDGKSFTEPDAEFRRMGRQFMAPSTLMMIKTTLLFFFPAIAQKLRIKFMPKNVEEWFTTVVLKSIKYRQENNIVRNDYLDLMISLKDKPGEYVFTDTDVIAQAMTFYGDGFETSSIALSFTLYEIAANPDVQKKLQDEIDTVLEKHGGEITYDAIQEMSYLDKVFSEGLRMYPPGTALIKLCTQNTTLPPAKEGAKSFEVHEGMSVIIPVLALHNDPQYYPEPEKFDPERHSEEGKATRPKHTYLPFGDGPRQCLGFRFAMAQSKAAIVYIVKEFEIKVNEKTKRPLKFDPKYFMPAAVGGLWLNFHKRTSNVQ